MTGKHRGLNAPAAAEIAERKRRSTLDLFNDEMSVLERPLEGDVEYYDEVPPPSHWKKVAMFVAAAAMTTGGALVAMRHFPPKQAVAEVARATPATAAVAAAPSVPAPIAPAPSASASAASAPAASVPAASAPVAALVPPKVAVAANEPAEEPGGDGAQGTDEAPGHQAPVKPSAWTKVGHHAEHARHSRSDKAGARHHKRHH